VRKAEIDSISCDVAKHTNWTTAPSTAAVCCQVAWTREVWFLSSRG